MEVEKTTFRELSNFFPKQMMALERSEVFDFLLYGGTLGAGKSRWIRWMAIYWLLKWYEEFNIPGIRAGVFCEDYPSLNDRHITYIKEEFPSWLGKFNEQRHEFKLAPEYGGGVVAFRNLDDPEKYLSVEFGFAGIDEINRNPFETFNKIRRRMRWPGIDRPKFVAGCNPIGEPWVRDIWIDQVFPEELLPLKDQFHFLEAKPTDNPYLAQKYYDDLKTQDKTFVDAALGGNWHAYDVYMDKDGYMPIISSNSVRDAQNANHDDHVGIMAICIDPAAGGDDSAMTLCSETVKEVLFSQPLEDTMVLAGMAITQAVKYDCEFIVIDKSGLGKPIYDRIKELLRFKKLEIEIIGVDFGDEPDDPIQFKDKKAELFFKEVNWILTGGKLVKHVRWNEWSNIKYKINSDQVKELEPKKRLRSRGAPSPDVLDSGVIYHAIDLDNVKRKIHRKKFGDQTFHDNIKDSLW